MLLKGAEVDKKLADLIFRHALTKVAHTQIEDDIARLSSLGIFKQFITAVERVFHLLMFQGAGLVYNFGHVLSVVAWPRICNHRLLKLLDFK